MCAGHPAIAVEFVVIETKLTNELGMLRTAAFDAFTDVEDDKAVAPVAHVNQSVHNLDVMKIAAAHERLVAAFDFFGGCCFSLPAGDFLWCFGVLEVDNAQRTCRVVG